MHQLRLFFHNHRNTILVVIAILAAFWAGIALTIALYGSNANSDTRPFLEKYRHLITLASVLVALASSLVVPAVGRWTAAKAKLNVTVITRDHEWQLGPSGDDRIFTPWPDKLLSCYIETTITIVNDGSAMAKNVRLIYDAEISYFRRALTWETDFAKDLQPAVDRIHLGDIDVYEKRELTIYRRSKIIPCGDVITLVDDAGSAQFYQKKKAQLTWTEAKRQLRRYRNHIALGTVLLIALVFSVLHIRQQGAELKAIRKQLEELLAKQETRNKST